MSHSRGSPRPRDGTCVSCNSCVADKFFMLNHLESPNVNAIKYNSAVRMNKLEIYTQNKLHKDNADQKSQHGWINVVWFHSYKVKNQKLNHLRWYKERKSGYISARVLITFRKSYYCCCCLVAESCPNLLWPHAL